MQKKILIVEDFEDTRCFLKFYLESEGHEVVEAVTGREAVEFAADVPDLILMDYNLPEMDGLAAIKLIKANPVSDKIPIVMVTAYSNRLSEDAVKAGCCCILSKPVDLKDLRRVIKQCPLMCI